MSYYIVGRLCFVGVWAFVSFVFPFVFVRCCGNWWGPTLNEYSQFMKLS